MALKSYLQASGKWTTNDTNVTKILRKYLAIDQTIQSQFVLKNPFTKSYFSDTWTSSSDGPLSFSSVVSSVGGLDVTNIADGLAKFLVKRAKQELSMAFFDKLKTALDSAKDLQILFPQTTNLLKAMGDQVYNYEAYLQNLREAFKKDISNLPKNMPGLITGGTDSAYFNKHQDVKASLLSACYIVNAIQEQQHPGDMLEYYPVEYLDSLLYFKGSIQTLQLLSASLKDTATSDSAAYWVSIKKVQALVTDKDAFQIYLGLLYQKALTQYDSIHFNKQFTLISLFNAIPVDKFDSCYTPYKKYIQGFAVKLDVLNKAIKSYSKPANDSLALELYAKYFQNSVDMIAYASTVSDLPYFNQSAIKDLPAKLKPYLNVAYAVEDLAVAINRKNYSDAINQAVYVYKVVIADSTGANKTLASLVQYGGFMATIVTAKNSDDVESAIEAFALPAGSSRIKRESAFNVSVNAYAGLYAGYEKYLGDAPKWPFSKVNSYGITAPIGVAISWGHRILPFTRTCADGWSSSLFISLIDLGAVTAFRFGDSTSQAPVIQLKNILSPGAFLSIGIPKTPLSVNFGAQIGPNLRSITNSSGTTSANNDDKAYIRFSASFCVDLPLLNLYTKSR
ncbi:hypothetical protein F5148DRAFT_1287114 [Russula earlei]|uniref:Uncharacterized protein n=1 Tax=Russula earlei TaxID=71964 RepID=A0ACC0U3V0_9AGAM|nr:hypothetical protein F5148DRAFT_1287114 [Russula earlei]